MNVWCYKTCNDKACCYIFFVIKYRCINFSRIIYIFKNKLAGDENETYKE